MSHHIYTAHSLSGQPIYFVKYFREIMKLASTIKGLIALVVVSSGSLFAASDLSAADIVSSQQSVVAACSKNEIGKITKVDVISGKEVAKLTKGQMKVDPTKKFVVVYSQRGKIKATDIPNATVASDLTAADLSAKLIGKPACVMEPQD